MTPALQPRMMKRLWPALLLVLLTAMTLAAPASTPAPELSTHHEGDGLAITLRHAPEVPNVIIELRDQDGKHHLLAAHKDGDAWEAIFPKTLANATVTARADGTTIATTTYQADHMPDKTDPGIALEVDGKPYEPGKAGKGTKTITLKANGTTVATFTHDFSHELPTDRIEARTDAKGGVAAHVPDHRGITLHVPLNGDRCNVKICSHALAAAGCTDENTRYAHPEPVNGTCPVTVDGTYAKDDPDGTDFLIQDADLNLSTTSPTEGENVTLNVTVHNTGTTWADNVTVLINDTSTGTLLKNHTIANFTAGSQETITTWLNATLGPHHLQATVDPNDRFTENNETNNHAATWLNATAWHTFIGNTTHTTVLADDQHTLYDWPREDTQGNIYVTDTDADIDWNSLQALGVTTSNTTASQDLAEADNALNLTGHNDSITATYGEDNSTPRTTSTFTVHGTTIHDVPVTNSTNTSSFQTGILWDTSQDSDGEYDGTEPLVFVTAISQDTTGKHGTYDYEITIPATLRDTTGTTSQTAFYMETR